MNEALLLTPEHLHVALNHVPLIGFGAAMIPLLYALILRNRTAYLLSFLMILLFGAAVFAVMETGEGAYARFQDGPLQTLLDDAGRDAMYTHLDAANFTVKFIHAEAALGLAGLLACWKFERALYPLGMLSLVLGLICIGLMVNTAAWGGYIRHPEFRPSPVSTNAVPTP